MMSIEAVFVDNDTTIRKFKKGLMLENNFLQIKLIITKKRTAEMWLIFFYCLICTRVQMDINEKL